MKKFFVALRNERNAQGCVSRPVAADIAAVVEDEAGAVVTPGMLTGYGVGKEDLFRMAIDESIAGRRPVMMPIEAAINALYGGPMAPPAGEAGPLFVLTNRQLAQGAAVMMYDGLLDEVKTRLGGSFYILPSSVHEVLVTPVDAFDSPDDLRDIVREVSGALEKEDFLSDEVLIYDGELRAADHDRDAAVLAGYWGREEISGR